MDGVARAAILGAVRRVIRSRQLSVRTEETYLRWAERFLRFMDPETPDGLCAEAARRFMEHLAVEQRLSASTQNQAASAIAFLQREVLNCPDAGAMPRAKGKQRRPSVLSPAECNRVLRELGGRNRLVAALLYGSGLRLTECLHMRVKDVSFDPQRLMVRNGKGGKDRETILADRAAGAVRRQIERVARVHAADRERGGGWARLPGALDRKSPREGYELAWQFLFPSREWSKDPTTGRMGRHHVHPSAIQRAVKEAVRRTGLPRHVSCHTFRHSFATHALRMGYDVRVVQELMGHKDLKTTMTYLHVLDRPGFGLQSPLDRLGED